MADKDYLYLTSQEVQNQRLGFLPVGSVEAHGAALPLGTDLLIVLAFAHAFARATAGVVLPPVTYGVCASTKQFKGSLAVSTKGLMNYLEDVCISLKEQKWVRIIIINIHNGNDPIIEALVQNLFDRYRYTFYYINPYTFLKGEPDEKVFTGKDNSYKEACLLHASLRILGNSGRESKYMARQNQKSHGGQALGLLRRYGAIGFAYQRQEDHIAGRRDVDVEAGLNYIERASQKMKELIIALDKHIQGGGS